MSAKFREVFEGFENTEKYGLLADCDILSYSLKNDNKLLY